VKCPHLKIDGRCNTVRERHAQREALYAEFIVEASKRLADAWSHHAESPDVLFSAIERMRVYIGFLDVPLTTILAIEDAQIGQSAESRRSATGLHPPNLQWPIAANFSTVCLMEEGMRHFFCARDAA
jgi:hypothetical protein